MPELLSLILGQALEGADSQGTTAVQADNLLSMSSGSGEDGDSTSLAALEDGTDVLWKDDRIFLRGKRAGGTFYGLTDNGEVIAVDAMEGEQQWSVETPIQVQDFVVTDTHVVLSNYKKISALDIESGEEQWRKVPDAKQVLDSVELEEWAQELIDDPSDVSLKFGTVRVSNGTLLVTEVDATDGLHVVSGRDLATGDPLWFQQNAWLSGVTQDQFFSAFGTWDVGTGDSDWHVSSKPPYETSPPLQVIATQDHILISGGHPNDPDQGRLVAFHQSDGAQSWSLDLDDRIWRCIAVADTIYATTTAGSLLAISSSSQETQTGATTDNQGTTQKECGEPKLSPDSSKVGETVAFTGTVEWKGEAAMEISVWNVRMNNPSSQKFQEVSEGDCVTVEGVWAQNRRSGDFYIEDTVITE